MRCWVKPRDIPSWAKMHFLQESCKIPLKKDFIQESILVRFVQVNTCNEACACLSQWGLNAGKSPSSNFSLFHESVSSFLTWSMCKSTRLEADIRWVFAVLPEKSLWSGFWTILFCHRPDESVIDLTAISTLRIIIWSIAVKIASWTQFSTAVTA